MRYTRLRRQIESGTLIGTHGTPFSSNTAPSSSSSAPTTETIKKRKRSPAVKKNVTKDKPKRAIRDEDIDAEGEDEDLTDDLSRIGAGATVGHLNVAVVGQSEKKVEVKIERQGSAGLGFVGEESESESDGTEWESEDEIPLAKLRKAKLVFASATPAPVPLPVAQTQAIDSVMREVAAPISTAPFINQGPVHNTHSADTIRNFEMQAICAKEEEYRRGLQIEIPRYIPHLPLPMHAPLPPFGETFGPHLLRHTHNRAGWGQFEDSRIGWECDQRHGQMQNF
jgi:hypothetical protein